jgi:hypothetical protein
MARRICTAIALVALVPIIARKKSASLQTAADRAYCAITSVRSLEPGNDTELRIWELQSRGVSRLTARLLVATDGKVRTPCQLEYKWEPPGSASGRLMLIIQDGKAFGAQGRLPLLALDLQGSPTPMRTEISSRLLVPGDLKSRMTNVVNKSERLPQQSILYAQLFMPDDGAGALNLQDAESLAESSKGGRTVMAVALDWAVK